MALGRAVLATGWSGVMEYMDATCAALINYTLCHATAHEPARRADMVASDRLVFAPGAA